MNHMLKDIGEKMKKYPGSIAKVSQDFNIISTFENFFLPHWACISANCTDFANFNVISMSIVLAHFLPLKNCILETPFFTFPLMKIFKINIRYGIKF